MNDGGEFEMIRWNGAGGAQRDVVREEDHGSGRGGERTSVHNTRRRKSLSGKKKQLNPTNQIARVF